MKAKYLLIIIGLTATSIIAGALSQDAHTNISAAFTPNTNHNYWHPDILKLDVEAQIKGYPDMFALRTLAHDVTNFYQLLRDKKWHECYELRAKAFREDVPEAKYLAEAKRDGTAWSLVDYDVLDAQFENSVESTNVDQASLICKFIELPHNTVFYSTVYWHYEDGIWRCLSAGPLRLTIFQSLRRPLIDWR